MIGKYGTHGATVPGGAQADRVVGKRYGSVIPGGAGTGMLGRVKSEWHRPYPTGRGRWLVVGWELAGLAFLGWTSARLYDLAGAQVWLLTAALAAVWVVGSYRIIRMGVYVNGAGVRIRGLLRSRTLRWSDIDGFALDQPVYRLGGFRLPAGMTVLVRHRDGRYSNTSLWAQGIDFHRRPRLFREVYGVLCERHLATVGD